MRNRNDNSTVHSGSTAFDRSEQNAIEQVKSFLGLHDSESCTVPSAPCADALGLSEAELLELRDRLGKERSNSGPRWEHLASQPSARQQVLVNNTEAYRTWALVEALAEESWSRRFDDPRSTATLAATALLVAQSLCEESYPKKLLADLRCFSAARYANALRICANFEEAESLFEQATQYCDEGTGDLHVRANLFVLKRSLHVDKEDLEGAFQMCLDTEELLQFLGDEVNLARSIQARARIRSFQKGAELEAVALNRESIVLFEKIGDDRGLLAAKHSLLSLLTELGELDQATELLEEARALHAHFGDRVSLLRLRWTEGRILALAERYDEAETAFLEARNGLISAGLGYDAAEVSLQLAALYLSIGRIAETKQLCSQMLPIFQSRDVHQAALAALIMFRSAVETEKATVELAQEVLSFLVESRQPSRAAPAAH